MQSSDKKNKEDRDNEKGLRIVLEKVRRKGVYHLPSVSIMFLFCILNFISLILLYLYYISKKIKR